MTYDNINRIKIFIKNEFARQINMLPDDINDILNENSKLDPLDLWELDCFIKEHYNIDFITSEVTPLTFTNLSIYINEKSK